VSDALALPFADEQTVERIAQTYAEPDWLRAERHDALRRARELPVEVNPLFTLYVDLRAARLAEIQPYLEITDAPQVSAVVPEGAAGILAIDGDRVVARALSPEAQAAGVVLDTLVHGLAARPELLSVVRGLVEGGRSLPHDDKQAQLARALAPVGVLVHIPAGTQLAKPLVVRWSAGEAGRGLISRTLINVERGASASILEEQVPSGADGAAASEPQSMWWGTAEVALGDGATLDFAGQQDFGPNTLALVNRYASLGRDAQLRWSLASIGARIHKSRIDNMLVGRGSSVQQAEIGFADASQLFDLTSYTRHIGEDTTGDLLSKGIFLDRSRGYIKGLIEIQRTAKGTDSFLGEFAMLLTKKARSVTIPSLEIDQPDVRRASHSSAVGPIDESQVFYLMSRGVPRDLARKFIVLGFLEPVVARIPLPEAQERLRELIDRKWPQAEAQAA
jgi:Fe-S cluster assembly protein SufB